LRLTEINFHNPLVVYQKHWLKLILDQVQHGSRMFVPRSTRQNRSGMASPSFVPLLLNFPKAQSPNPPVALQCKHDIDLAAQVLDYHFVNSANEAQSP
jgi:hypothetical protein